MFTLINFVKLRMQPQEPDDFADQYLYWERALEASTGPFIDGQAVRIRDLLLFGVVQCHSGIPVPPLEPLRSDERLRGLRQWLAACTNDSRTTHIFILVVILSHLSRRRCLRARCSVAFFYLGVVAMLLLIQ